MRDDKRAVEARGMSVAELQRSLDWNKALREHSDENMDFQGYSKCQEKIEIIEAELRRRNYGRAY